MHRDPTPEAAACLGAVCSADGDAGLSGRPSVGGTADTALSWKAGVSPGPLPAAVWGSERGSPTVGGEQAALENSLSPPVSSLSPDAVTWESLVVTVALSSFRSFRMDLSSFRTCALHWDLELTTVSVLSRHWQDCWDREGVESGDGGARRGGKRAFLSPDGAPLD
ncbi:hypothetical protein ACOMHN_001325 [Nucella lapillus]